MDLQVKSSDTGFLISGLYKDVQQSLASTDADLGMLFAGIVMGLHYGNDGRMVAEFNLGARPADQRPLEFYVSLGEDGQPETLACRFLDEETRS